jgi:hypothetical protein
MRNLILGAVALLAMAGAAAAQPQGAPAPQPPPSPPRVFLAAGYSQPDITPGFCRVVDPGQAQCTIPAMTAGRYLVLATGTSTATAADAAQQIQIAADDQGCTATRGADAKQPWAVGAKNTLVAACALTVISDTPVTVVVLYRDMKATKAPAGPQVSIRRVPWVGVFAAQPVQVQVNQPPPAQSR